MPAARRTTLPVGSQAECGTRTSIWRRAMSRVTVGAAPATGAPLGGVRQLGGEAGRAGVHGQELARGRDHVRAVRGTDTLLAGEPPSAIEKASSDGSLSVFSVTRNAVASASGFDAQLDEVGGVVRVGRVGRIRVGAVRLRERVAGGARVGRVGRLVRAVVVVEEVLVEVLAAAVRRRAGDEDRRRVPDAGVGQLRRVGRRRVEDGRPGPRAGAGVERGRERGRGKQGHRQHGRHQHRHTRFRNCILPPPSRCTLTSSTTKPVKVTAYRLRLGNPRFPPPKLTELTVG